MKILLIIVPLIATSLMAQEAGTAKVIVMHSWKTGTDTVRPMTIEIPLTGTADFMTEVESRSGRKYRLSAVPQYYKEISGSHWKIELRELRPGDKSEKQIGKDLLYSERPGGKADNFPREDLIGFFYAGPQSGPPINGAYWAEGKLPFYDWRTERRVIIEKFCVVLRARPKSSSESESRNIVDVEFRSVEGCDCPRSY